MGVVDQRNATELYFPVNAAQLIFLQSGTFRNVSPFYFGIDNVHVKVLINNN